MDSNFSGISSGVKALTTQPYAPAQTKNLTQPGATGGTADPALAGWYEQAYAYYNAVTSGAEAKPDPAAWQEFMNQMNWAAGQLGYGGATWDPSQGGAMGAGMPGAAMGQQQANQFGGTAGTMDNWVYTDQKARIGFTGDGTHDIWSNDVNIDVAPTSGKVTSEITTDTRFQPNEQVLKITVTDPATGTQAVYFVHDYQDAKVKVNTPTPNQLTDNTGGLVTGGKFTPGGSASADGESSKPSTSTGPNGELVYEYPYGTTINFTPQGDGTDATHEVWTDANIAVMPSDTLTVSKWEDPANPGTYLGERIIVKHSDGSTDTFNIHSDFKVGINARPSQITWDGVTGHPDSVPAGFDDITLGTTGGDTGAGAIGPSQPRVVKDGVAIVDTETDPEFVTTYDTSVAQIDITAPGKVTIHGATFGDSFKVSMDGDWVVIEVTGKDANGNTKTVKYRVDKSQVDSIVLDTDKDISGLSALPSDIKSKIQKASESSDTGETSGAAQKAQTLSDVDGITMSSSEITQKAADAGLDLNYPPAVPNDSVWKFLTSIDPVLANLAKDFLAAPNKATRELIYAQVRDRLVTTLKIVYPNANVSAVSGTDGKVDNIMFSGQQIDIIKAGYNDGNFNASGDPADIFHFEAEA